MYLVENLDPASQAGLQLMSDAQTANLLPAPELADSLDEAMHLTGNIDDQACVLSALYRNGSIPRSALPFVTETFTSIDPAESLTNAILDLEGNGIIKDESFYDGISKAIYYLERNQLEPTFINPQGLAVSKYDEHGNAELQNVPLGPMQIDIEELSLAEELGLTHFGFQTELVWKESEESVLSPNFVSDRQHCSLGRLSALGTFEPVVTVLDKSHPARANAITSEA